jgi:ferrous iron transport protein A
MHKNIVSLTSLAAGHEGKVIEFQGGRGMARRLETRGIRLGHTIKKVSNQFLRGPVTVKVGHTTLAIGHGIANRVMVEVNE